MHIDTMIELAEAKASAQRTQNLLRRKDDTGKSGEDKQKI